MNLIVHNVPQIKWYTDLYPFVVALGRRVNNYVWRFDAVEANVDFPVEEESGGYWRLTGNQIQDLVEQRPLFFWAVISAIPSSCSDDDINAPCSPYADGNPTFWIGSPSPQHPQAEFEIVCWDSGATLLIGADDVVAAAFRSAYPGSIDLDRANQRRGGLPQNSVPGVMRVRFG